MLRTILLAALAAVLLLPAAAPAAPQWLDSEPLGTHPYTEYLDTHITSDGEVLVSLRRSSDRVVILRRTPGRWDTIFDKTAWDVDVDVDGRGGVVAMWFHGGQGWVGARDAGGVFEVTPLGAASGRPLIEAGRDGSATAVWHHQGKLKTATRAPGGDFEVAELGPGSSGQLTLAAGDGGRAFVAWRAAQGGLRYRLRPAGGAFSQEQTLASGTSHSDLTASMNAAGELQVAWLDSGVYGTHIRAGQTTLAEPVRLTPEVPAGQNEGYNGPRPAVSEDGSAFVVISRSVGPSGGTQRTRYLDAVERDGDVYGPAAHVTPPRDETAGLYPLSAAPVSGGRVMVAWSASEGDDEGLRVAVGAPGQGFAAHDTVPLGGVPTDDAAVAGDAAGNLAVVYDVGDIEREQEVRFQGFDGTGPVLRASGPSTLAPGERGAFSARASDVFGGGIALTWDFGATGGDVEHAWTTPGAKAATVTATDARGNASTASVAVDVPAPPAQPADAPASGRAELPAAAAPPAAAPRRAAAKPAAKKKARCKRVVRKVRGKRRTVKRCAKPRTAAKTKRAKTRGAKRRH